MKSDEACRARWDIVRTQAVKDFPQMLAKIEKNIKAAQADAAWKEIDRMCDSAGKQEFLKRIVRRYGLMSPPDWREWPTGKSAVERQV